jgi:putative membrane protein
MPMSEKQPTNKTNTRTEGRHFDPLADNNSDEKSKLGKIFTPSHDEILIETPESITAGERLPHVSEYTGIRLEALPPKGLKTFLYSLGLLLMCMACWEIYRVVMSALAHHWLLAAAFIVLILIVGALGVKQLVNFFKHRDNQAALNNIRQHAARIKQEQDFGQASQFIEQLTTFYEAKPQAVYLKRSLKTLADYSNDRETLAHLERSFIEPLDQEALRRVSKFSVQTGIVVTISPWASLDMALALWRSLKLIDEVAQVYGIRPSFSNRCRLLKQVLHQLAFVGGSEMIIDPLLEEMGGVTLLGLASARAAQGLGAGIYTAKIGIAAIKVSRPIEQHKKNDPTLASLIKPIILAISQKLKGKA